MQGTGNEGFAGGLVANKGSAESRISEIVPEEVLLRVQLREEWEREWEREWEPEWERLLEREWQRRRLPLNQFKLDENQDIVRDSCNSIHDVGFTSGGITNGGSTGGGIANVFAGAGGSGGPPGAVHDPIAVVGIPCGIGNGARAGGGIANGFEGVGGLEGSPGEDWSGIGGPYWSGIGGPPLGGGGDGESPSGGGCGCGESPSGGGGGGGPGGPPGEGVGGGGSYKRVRTTVIVDESEIVCIVKARGRAQRRMVRTSVKARPGKIRHAVRFKRVNSLQGQAEM